MSTPVKSNHLELYRLAKKVSGLSRTEKQTLLAIADTCSMRDAVCRKSKTTIDKERGLAPRSFYDGIHGRKRKDGTEYFPGLLKRGIVFVKAGGFKSSGLATTYGIDIASLSSLAEVLKPRHKVRHKLTPSSPTISPPRVSASGCSEQVC